jgi:hypothetical protein
MLEFAQGFESAVAGREKVGGRDAIKLAISPTLQDVITLMKSMNPGLVQQQIGNVDMGSVDRGVKSITMTIWLDAAEYLPIKIEGVLVSEMNTLDPSGIGAVKTELKMSLTANMDYKTPFNIVLPSAAQNAPEIVMISP